MFLVSLITDIYANLQKHNLTISRSGRQYLDVATGSLYILYQKFVGHIGVS